MRIRKILENKITAAILLAAIIITQIIYMGAILNSGRNYLCDEVYSYGISNSYYMPFIEVDSFAGGGSVTGRTNINEWKDGEMLHNYVTVQPGEQFRYDSVWYNNTKDRHPPLYYAALHTICSFFPDTFSPWIPFILNAVFFTVSQIFLYKLMKNLLNSRMVSAGICMLWGFSGAAADLVLFVRMYCMLVMWTVILFYLHSELLKTDKQPHLKSLVPLIVVTACGTLTQFMFLFVAFITTVLFCIRYLIHKRFKMLFAYGFSMLGGVLLGFAVYPHGFFSLFSEASGGYPSRFRIQLQICLNSIMYGIFGFNVNDAVITCAAALLILAVLFIVSLPVQFLFRHSEKLKDFYRPVWSGIRSFPKKNAHALAPRRLWQAVKNASPLWAAMVISCVVIIMVTSYKVNFIITGYPLRYLYIICLPFIIAAVLVIHFLLTNVRYRRTIISSLLVCVTFFSLFNTQSVYSEKLEGNISDLNDLLKGEQCVIVEPSERLLSVFCIMPKEIRDVGSFYLTCYSDSLEKPENLAKAEKEKNVYLLLCVQEGADNARAAADMELSEEFLWQDGFHIVIGDYLSHYENIYGSEPVYIGYYQTPNTFYLVYRVKYDG